jgi:GT2 family glycosyltransferase/tetratricopeptide (TPR) repeat protein
MYRRADMVLTVTEEDRRRLREEAPELAVGISTDIHPLIERDSEGETRDLVFVGNYNHEPNEDAVLYFVERIMPLIKKKAPGVKLYVVGNNPTERIRDLASEEVIVTGFVPEVTPYLTGSRVFVVPLRYGAGLKGKIGEALAAGIPIVTTSIGAEGMSLVHERNAMIADDPEEFAECVIRVYNREELRRTLSEEGRRLAVRNYSSEAVERHWLEIFDFIASGRPEPGSPPPPVESGFKRLSPVPELAPNVGIVIPVYNNLDITRTCWTSIRKNTAVPHQVVVVDNGSTEDIAYEADQNNIQVVRHPHNAGFAAACNSGIRATHGDYVVILNNDTIVTPGWLGRMLGHMESDPAVGLVGPSTNFAASEQQIEAEYRTEKELYDFSERIYRSNKRAGVEVGKLVGVCLLIRRSVLEEIGLFDTRFGIGNFEDDDLCLRARLAGHRLVWAKDVFIHHRGSKTFEAMDLDYAALMEENRKKFAAKWSLVGAVEAVPNRREEAADSRDLVVILDPQTGSERLRSIRETAKDMRLVAVGGDRKDLPPDVEPLDTGTGKSPAGGLIDFLKKSRAENVILVGEGSFFPPDWASPLKDALRKEGAGCSIPVSNLGWGGERTPDAPKKSGKPAARFARKNALRRRGETESLELGYPSALAVRRSTLMESGLAGEFSTSALILELQRSLSDSGLQVILAPGSYVHCPEPASEAARREMEAVRELVRAGRALEDGHPDSALRHLDRALDIKKDYAQAYYQRGVINAIKGLDRAAEADFRRVLDLRPGDSRALNNLGCIEFGRGNLREAEADFNRAVESDPGNWEAAKNLADLCMYTNRPDRATDLYTRIIHDHSGCPEVYTSIAEVFASHGDRVGAEELYRMALRISPDHAGALEGLEALGRAPQTSTTGG